MRLAWLAVIVVVALLGACGGSETKPGASTPSGAASADSEAPGGANVAAIDGEKLYNRYCFSCHAAGIADAPKFGDAEAWKPRIAKGREALLQSVIDGMPPGMPVKGLCIGCSDAELKVVTDYMLDAVAAE